MLLGLCLVHHWMVLIFVFVTFSFENDWNGNLKFIIPKQFHMKKVGLSKLSNAHCLSEIELKN